MESEKPEGAKVPCSALLGLAQKKDDALTNKLGFRVTVTAERLKRLIADGSVEVGWRECCGKTDGTMHTYREWKKLMAAAKKKGVLMSVTPVKHKNGYATNNGGFWNSEIYALPNA